MKTKLIYPLIIFAAVACHRDSASTSQQKQYETVQEGSASGVTSTIQGPGETLPPITGTNADTTTAFTIDPNLAGAAPAAQPAPNAMGTVPREPMGGVSPFPGTPATAPVTSRPATQVPPTPMTPRPTPTPREVPRPATPPQHTETVAPPPTPAPPPTETEEPPPPPPQQTDTTTTTAPPPEDTDTAKTDTEEPPPPPPPSV